MARMDHLSTSVHQHAELFESLQKSMVAQQTVMSEMMLKLSKLERGHQPPLLPSPPPPQSSPPINLIGLSSTPGMTPPRLPKLEVPLFSGDNVHSWIFQIQLFYTYHSIPEEQKIYIAAFYMTGVALQWYQWLSSTNQLTTWEALAQQAEFRFGPSTFINHEARLFKIKQHSSVTAYLTEFEGLSTRISGLSTTSLLNCFLSGLRDDIQHELYILKPTSLPDAMGLAKMVEDKINAARALTGPPRPYNRPPLPSSSLPTPTPFIPRQNPTGTSLPVKRLTPSEMAARREKSLCYNCDSPFTRGHRCKPPKFLCLLADEGEETTANDDLLDPPLAPTAPDPPPDTTYDPEVPCISFHALNGVLGPSTLKLPGKIHNQDVVVLIDGDSTNNFI